MGRLYTHAIPRADEHLGPQHAPLPAPRRRPWASPARTMSVWLWASPPSPPRRRSRFLCAQPGYDPRKPLVVLHPGTSQDTKCWPAASFAAVAAALGGRFNCRPHRQPEGACRWPTPSSPPCPPGAPPPLVAAGRLPAHRPDGRAGRAGRRRRHRRHQRPAHRLRPGDAAGRRLRQHPPRRQCAPVRPARSAVRRHRALRAVLQGRLPAEGRRPPALPARRHARSSAGGPGDAAEGDP